LKIAFPTDQHCPFHDPRAVAVALQIVRDFQPDLLVSGSDGVDFYAVSKFDKNPERFKVTLQDEIDCWIQVQRCWRDAAPSARRVFIPGNHEDRMRRFVWDHPGVYGLRAMELKNLLELEALGIEYRPEAEIVVGGRLVIKHGSFIRGHSAATAKAELEGEKHSLNVLTGHSHRGGSHFVRTRGGIVQAVEGFCLCRLDPEYILRPNWQQGIVLATVSGEEVAFEPVLISGAGNSRLARWRGQEYRDG
jgi:hypothetical protein